MLAVGVQNAAKRVQNAVNRVRNAASFYWQCSVPILAAFPTPFLGRDRAVDPNFQKGTKILKSSMPASV